jgi:cytochrome P450
MQLDFTFTSTGRTGNKLPPSAPLPSSVQTLACRVRPLAYLKWCRERLGDQFVVYPIDMPPLVFLANPQEIRAVLTASPSVLHPGAGAAVAAPLFGEHSFMLLEEDAHMSVRSAITPAFRRGAVAEHVEIVAEIVREEIRSWPLDRAFASHPLLRALTLRVILRTIFGEENAELRVLHRRLLDMLSVTASLVLQEPRVRYLPGWRATWRRFVARREEVDESILALVSRRTQMTSARHDMLEMLLAVRRSDGSSMSARELRDNLVSTIIAGHETTASALAWSFQLLSHSQRVQERLASEIDAGEGEEYLTATIQEVLRHSPVFLFAAPRAVVKPIEIGDWVYHPPAHLLGCTYLVHHDPALYPNPQAFCPERFIGAAPQPRIWLPWGGGRKVCVGRHLALLEMQMVLRQTLSERILLPASPAVEHAHWRSVMVAPQKGSRVVMRSRVREATQRRAPLRERATV